MFGWPWRSHVRIDDPELPIVGLVEGVLAERLTGWVCSRLSAQARLTVVIEGEPGRCATTVANRYRADVQRAGFSQDGYCGFQIPLSDLSLQGPLRVIVDDFRVELPGSPVTLTAIHGARRRLR